MTGEQAQPPTNVNTTGVNLQMSSQPFTIKVPVPKQIVSSLRANFSGKDYQKTLTIVKSIIYGHMRLFAPMLYYLPYASDYKRKIVGGNRDYRLWRELENVGILQTKILPGKRRFSHSGHICVHLRINPKYISGDVEQTNYIPFRNDLHVEDSLVCRTAKANCDNLNLIISKDQVTELADELATRKISSFSLTKKGLHFHYKKKPYFEFLSPDLCAGNLLFERIKIAASYILSVNQIEQKQFFASVSSTNGRLNHNLTVIPKRLLTAFQLDGEPICEIDMKNCQPRILAQLISSIKMKEEDTNQITEPIWEDRFLNESFNNSLRDILFSQKKEQRSDIEEFIQQSECGTLYEYYSKQMFGYSDERTRNKAKEAFIAALYADPEESSEQIQEKREAFAKVFPDLLKVMDQLKRDMVNLFNVHLSSGDHPELKKYLYSKNKGSKTARKAGNDYLPVRMQEIESSLFIKIIFHELIDKGIISLPKHDSILCKESDKDIVMELMSFELDRELGKGGYELRSKILISEVSNPPNT
ncbi:MAG: hypothetical protein H6615_11655 [Ignavibacteria bacterium]|nr:hypothetical protein [Ignavibacteria bacterium]